MALFVGQSLVWSDKLLLSWSVVYGNEKKAVAKRLARLASKKPCLRQSAKETRGKRIISVIP